jgi:hypothetical protein
MNAAALIVIALCAICAQVALVSLDERIREVLEVRYGLDSNGDHAGPIVSCADSSTDTEQFRPGPSERELRPDGAVPVHRLPSAARQVLDAEGVGWPT